MLTTLGFIALLIGAILVIGGYTLEPRALRPGWGVVILGVVLILVGYVAGAHTTVYDASLLSL